jgi:putative flippase GtrA
MKEFLAKLRKLFLLKVKFAMTSSVATLLDYSLYLLLVYTILDPVPSNIISASCGMIANFFLQKRFVFVLQRKLQSAFLLAILVSLGGIALGTAIIWGLNHFAFFQTHQYLTKLCATGLVFFYNFYLKRFAFEKRFISFD